MQLLCFCKLPRVLASVSRLAYPPPPTVYLPTQPAPPASQVGRMVLNRNPDNFFNENEQLAFCPALVVPGEPCPNEAGARRRAACPTPTPHPQLTTPTLQHPMPNSPPPHPTPAPHPNHTPNTHSTPHPAPLPPPGIHYSDDKLLQTRIFSYQDTQRHRLGGNYLMLPVNAPRCPHHNNHHDGFMNFMQRSEEVGACGWVGGAGGGGCGVQGAGGGARARRRRRRPVAARGGQRRVAPAGAQF